MKKAKKYLLSIGAVAACCGTVFATGPENPTTGDIAGVIEDTWINAAGQIKTVVDSVVFPAMTMILAVAFFVKLAMCYFDYKKHGQMEWTGPVILFVCLVLVLTAPLYIWNIVGL